MSKSKPQHGVALPHFCQYLKQIPPCDYASMTNLCQWSLNYTNAAGARPFSSAFLTDSVLRALKTDFAVSVQHIVVNARSREAWARCWCQYMGVAIANETPALSTRRQQQVSPMYFKQQIEHYRSFLQRSEALKKMQQRKAQQGNS